MSAGATGGEEELRPSIKRILRDLLDEDDDIATYAAMNVLRLRTIQAQEIRKLVPVSFATSSVGIPDKRASVIHACRSVYRLTPAGTFAFSVAARTG